MRVLLVEDDELLGEGLRAALVREGHAVDWLRDGEHARQAATRDEGWDVVLLDLGLPRRDGMDVLRDVRRRSDVPVLILTARDRVEDRVEGLDAGADDYLVKPFEIAELKARLRALSSCCCPSRTRRRGKAAGWNSRGANSRCCRCSSRAPAGC
jgi:two-component system, OmpR family, response regulator QseB